MIAQARIKIYTWKSYQAVKSMG